MAAAVLHSASAISSSRLSSPHRHRAAPAAGRLRGLFRRRCLAGKAFDVDFRRLPLPMPDALVRSSNIPIEEFGVCGDMIELGGSNELAGILKKTNCSDSSP